MSYWMQEVLEELANARSPEVRLTGSDVVIVAAAGETLADALRRHGHANPTGASLASGREVPLTWILQVGDQLLVSVV
jgi:hypothetical protein